MGQITSACYNNNTQLQDTFVRDHPLTQRKQRTITQQKPISYSLQLDPIPQNIKQTFQIAYKSKYFNNLKQKIKIQDESIFQIENFKKVMKNMSLINNNNNEQNLKSSTFGNMFDFLNKNNGNCVIGIKKIQNEQQLNRQSLNLIKNNNNQQKQQRLNGPYFLIFPNKQYFLGLLSQSLPTYGIFIFKPLCYYIGSFNNILASGQGQYTNKQNGYRYQGQWNKNLQHGQGKQYYSNGDQFSGKFIYGNKLGYGVYKFNDGRRFQGEYYNNLCNGNGTYIVNKKQFYKGQWQYDQINGKGQYHYQNGDIYTGEWKNGQKNGHGKYKFTGGWQYEGEWENGFMHGKGKIKQGYDQIEGYWENGNKIN